MTTREKYEDWITGSQSRGGPTLSEWLHQQQVDGWKWDGQQPTSTLDEQRRPVLRHRFVR